MEVNVSISVFSNPNSSFGNVTGNLSLPAVPSVGDQVCFAPPLRDADIQAVKHFNWLLKVKSIILVPGDPGQILCGLEEIVLDSEAKASEVVAYLESGFDLFFEPHNL